jgi:hypothetical protein
MIETTRGQIYVKQVTASLDHVLYVFHDGAVIFYIGCTPGERGVLRRVRYHSDDPLSHLISYNRPASDAWQIQLLALQDCSTFLSRRYPTYERGTKDEWRRIGAIKTAESDLIVHLHPCVNIREHRLPMLLPAKYCPPFWRKMPTGYWSRVMHGALYAAKPEAAQTDAEYLADEEIQLANAYLLLQQAAYKSTGRECSLCTALERPLAPSRSFLRLSMPLYYKVQH